MEAAQPPAERDPRRIDAEPTKDFFISMLVRDIELIPAITDLVDNSLDGARRVRGGETFQDLWVKVTVEQNAFVIEDNCGGIDIGRARGYAFRFGRPEDAERLEHSVGQFGVGMKRALFKLGKKFVVKSTAQDSQFQMTVHVEDWRENEDWSFKFDEGFVEDAAEDFAEDERGTRIEVTELHEGVASDFATDQFLADLRADLERRHQLSVTKGLAISVNNETLEPVPVHFAVSDAIKPAQTELEPDGVSVTLDAGIAESDGNAGGWHIFCNDRLIVAADQSELTGWGWKGGEARMPKFHAQYARFRGYAFFEAEDASLLPWNTTKTSVDQDSAVFRQARREMLAIGRPVLDFLNNVADEIGARRNGDDGPLEGAVKEAEGNLRPFDQIEYADAFVRPAAEPIEPEGPETSAIHYDRPVEQIDRLKELFHVRTNYEVGERTFDQFYTEAFGDDE